MMGVDRELRLANEERLRLLSVDKAGEVRVICAHGAIEFESCAAGKPL